MSDDPIIRRDIVLVTLPANDPRGRDQEGTRPAVVTAISNGRYPLVLVVPLTTQMGDWVDRNPILYPQLEKGSGGLSKPSVALLDLRPICRNWNENSLRDGTDKAESPYLKI